MGLTELAAVVAVLAGAGIVYGICIVATRKQRLARIFGTKCDAR